jgi:hypothetical protein
MELVGVNDKYQASQMPEMESTIYGLKSPKR